MTREEKKMLLADLSLRLPYGVYCKVDGIASPQKLMRICIEDEDNILLRFESKSGDLPLEVYLSEVRPYLFPMSTLSRESLIHHEAEAKDAIWQEVYDVDYSTNDFCKKNAMWCKAYFYEVTWYAERHYDLNGLISKKLAIEMTEDIFQKLF